MASRENPSTTSRSPPTALSRLKSHHRLAFHSLAAALDLDEKIQAEYGGLRQCRSAADLDTLAGLYRVGIDELRAGLALKCPSGEVAEKEKFSQLQSKMRDNLTRAQDRMLLVQTAADAAAAATAAVAAPSTTSYAVGRRGGKAGSAASSPAAAAAAAVAAQRTRPTSKTSKAGVGRPPSKQQPQHQQPRPRGSSARPSVSPSDLKGVDTALALSILNEVLDQSPGVTFDDVVGNEPAKQALREATVLPALRPDLFSGLRQPATAVLLFGPPGNGKTLLAKAVATEAGGVFFNISAGSLVSKWVGEAEKLVRALFALARKLAPAVIFIDEVDSILCNRSDKETEVSRRLKTQFLVELDGVRGGGGGGGSASSGAPEPRVFLLAATNRPAELDPAVIRRFSRRLYVGMPEAEARADLLRALLARHDSVRVSEAELDELSELTEGYSASDLANLAREAAMEPLRQIRPDRLATVAKGAVRPLTAADLRNCLARVRPSVPLESLRDLLDWNDKYGDGSAVE